MSSEIPPGLGRIVLERTQPISWQLVVLVAMGFAAMAAIVWIVKRNSGSGGSK